MKINNRHYHTIWEKENDPTIIRIIDQRRLPFDLSIADLRKPGDFAAAIRDMMVRGAPLIGVTAAYGMYSAALSVPGEGNDEAYFHKTAETLKSTRPTAVDLFYAVDISLNEILKFSSAEERSQAALEVARRLRDESIESCRKIGENGLPLIKKLQEKKNGDTVNILTHCNAGWLACIDYGTATAPIYMAYDQGIKVHVWVDETRPRSQGARLTAYELAEHGVPHTVITDNAGGHLMQHGMVDMVIVGTDRTTRQGDVANKIGTYLKALAAFDNEVPFYVGLPSSTIDWTIRDGVKETKIETRSEREITHVEGWDGEKINEVRITPEKSRAQNYGFDVTPARLVTRLITDRGVCDASETGLLTLYPEKSAH